MRNLGLILDPIADDHWFLGSGKATERFGGAELNPSADWTPYDPERELQRRNGLETMNCTNFATGNALIALAKFHGFVDFPENLSERYTGVLTGTRKNGNSPHHVIEIIRKESGVIHERELPWTDEDTWEEYYSPNPMDENLVALGRRILDRYEIGQEWVWKEGLSPEEKHRLLREALKRGPVCVSVRAWKKEGKLYTKSRGEGDNHWVLLLRFDGSSPVIRDQYSPFVKELSSDYDFERAKVYFMSHKESVLEKIRDLLLKVLGLYKKKAELEQQIVEPSQPQTKPMKSTREILYETAKASIGKDMSPRDLAPDALGCAESLNGVFEVATGKPILKNVVGTNALWKQLGKDPRFERVTTPLPGDIVMNPTGTSTKGAKNGHCGVWGVNNVMSNDSDTGKWDTHFTLKSWRDYYEKKLGFPTYFYRPR